MCTGACRLRSEGQAAETSRISRLSAVLKSIMTGGDRCLMGEFGNLHCKESPSSVQSRTMRDELSVKSSNTGEEAITAFCTERFALTCTRRGGSRVPGDRRSSPGKAWVPGHETVKR